MQDSIQAVQALTTMPASTLVQQLRAQGEMGGSLHPESTCHKSHQRLCSSADYSWHCLEEGNVWISLM